MVNRTHFSIITAVGLLVPVLLLGAFRTAPELLAASPQAGRSGVAANIETGEVRVEWVVRVSDLMACQPLTPELRRLQHRHRGRIVIVAYPVAADTALVRSFLRRERLGQVALQPISESQFQREFARRLPQPATTPSLIVSHRGRRDAAFDVVAAAPVGRRGIPEFAAYITSLLQPGISLGDYPAHLHVIRR